MSNDRKGAASRPRALVFGAALGLLLVGVSSAQAPAPVRAPSPRAPCADAPAESPQACSGQPLDLRAARLSMRGGPIALPAGAVGHAYPDQPLLFGDSGALKGFATDGMLPHGVSVDAVGVLHGTPLSAGTFPFTLHALDTQGRSVTQAYVLYVVAPPAPPRPPAPRPAPPPPPPPPKPPAPPPEPVVQRQPGIIDTYEITADDVKALHKLLDKKEEPPPPVVVQNVNQSATTETAVTQAAPGQTAVAPPSTTQTTTTSTIQTSTSQTTVPAPPPPVKRPKPFQIKLPSISGVSAPQVVNRAVSDVNNALKPVNGIVAFLTPKPSKAPAGAAPAPAAPVPAPVQDDNTPFNLADKAAELQGVNYPSRALFIRALAARYPPLTTDIDDDFNTVVDRAHKQISFDAAPPLNWAQEPGCRCNQQPKGPDDKAIYGFLPFWGSSAKGPSIQFSEFDRIEFIGAQLRPDGLWIRPSNAQDNVSATTWWSRTSGLAAAAQAHGAQMDLVLQASDWAFLHGADADSAREQGVMAAQNAMAWVQTPLTGRGLHTLLFPFWKDPTHVFDGVTVMFSPPPPTADKGDGQAFDAFYDAFVMTLIEDMQSDGRDFTLNLMPPEMLIDATQNDEDRIRPDSPFWHDFLKYKKLAEPASAHRDQIDKERSVYVGKSNIAVRLLAPIREPSQDEKKVLRAAIDTITQVQGAGHVEEVRGSDRVEVLRGIIPILFLPSRNSGRLSDDMVFFKQNFGGIGLWPAPDSVNQKDVYQLLDQVMANDTQKSLVSVSFCNFAVRFIWQIMLLLSPLALLAYGIWGRPSGRPWLWLAVCAAVPAVTLVLSGFLLEFDPIWRPLKVGNLPLAIVVCAVIGATILVLRPRPPRP